MSYLVLARKYRPQTFDDLVGQDHVARTLANAISGGRIAHAFLFTGVRGVGKTTSARLLAKCLNCVGADGQQKGPTAKPCNHCAPCREITSGQDLDVQEIDGASYNGVDEVRRLQEGMTFRPARDRSKIYIVDEVHMLSTAAWNAFLKTLEEPPPHVVFIFATTEVQKVPVTILSRCQRYDFKLISTQIIAARLEQVLAQENVDAERAAIQVIAREAAGSMRDAMSLVDQVIAFSGTKLTAVDVTGVLGVADRKILHELGAALIDGNAAACLGVVDRLAQQGFDLVHVTRDVLRHLRNLVIAKMCAGQAQCDEPSLRQMLDLADEEVRDVLALTARADADDLSRCFQGFSNAYDDVVRSGHPRIALEMALVRLARRPPLLPLDELLARVGDLERRLGGAPPPVPAPRGGGGGTGRGIPVASAQIVTESAATRTRGALALAETPRLQVAEPGLPDGVATVQQQRGQRLTLVSTPSPRLDPVPPPPVDAAVVLDPARGNGTSATSPPAAALMTGANAWRAILERVRAARPAVASVLEHAIPLEVGAGRLVVGFEPSEGFLAARASEREAVDILTREARAYFGTTTHVAIESSARATSGLRTVASVDAERRVEELARARQAVEAHPLVEEALRLFGAKLIDVKLPAGDG
ncbi:MAG: DNA polymerase III subunit gamma/tau [Myxococcota bacterium]|nr:DNA polymerase III subunit gamma/tau [Myxococcota bacterium]